MQRLLFSYHFNSKSKFDSWKGNWKDFEEITMNYTLFEIEGFHLSNIKVYPVVVLASSRQTALVRSTFLPTVFIPAIGEGHFLKVINWQLHSIHLSFLGSPTVMHWNTHPFLWSNKEAAAMKTWICSFLKMKVWDLMKLLQHNVGSIWEYVVFFIFLSGFLGRCCILTDLKPGKITWMSQNN